ncbi:hypothetical protein BX616_000850 [Lobosporangium transversale]|uniref:mRNA stability protein n=1 Tax=Lobosporangium transversale TaxID=64571 RepID=A0A1Y2GEV1_9FUNG|nr:camp-regulated phospho protein/endosulfine conserved region-domain-containing protein [Lobosporangium transversale]KAF9917490.1 hypothetical protein BX616_000850 [Lobosporangium transversale]ORZ08820.1 camp-regulated phospho protein/endosulfine conserved region-domain-containing protein [Lobosporangium transversale]|eukprot:XP_021878603.1 camp-regulated phospho protein/endosulfine conserved region-domain-containing protein [Lobosporangium transversale]
MSSPLNPTNNQSAAQGNNTQTLTDQEQKLQRMYGKLPTGRDLLGHKLKERKYFDSGDYALSKAGKTSTTVGSQHPQPENIPHSNPTPPNATHGSPPVKESSLIHESEIPEGVSPTVSQSGTQ